MSASLTQRLQHNLQELQAAGTRKELRHLTRPMDASTTIEGVGDVLVFCSNNYLGLANHPEVIEAGIEGLRRYGAGTASVRFICGTFDCHRELEERIASFLGTEAAMTYVSCWNANEGLLPSLVQKGDAIISDELNHASIIDGVRLCKAQRFRYRNNDMADLEEKLKAAKDARFRMIATDGVFSMDGYLANLPAICELADKYDALVMVDDSHAVGFMGPGGGGTPEHFGVSERIDVLTGTLGKALGGASGGYTSGHKPIIDLLRQRSRPYLFSNSLAPPIAGASLTALNLIRNSNNLRARLHENSAFFREAMTAAGFNLLPGEHPIIPVMLGDAALAGKMSELLLNRGVYVIGFSFPVVPRGQARIRTQMSAAHTREDLQFAVEQFAAVKQDLGL